VICSFLIWDVVIGCGDKGESTTILLLADLDRESTLLLSVLSVRY